jgi:hypothetical protein
MAVLVRYHRRVTLRFSVRTVSKANRHLLLLPILTATLSCSTSTSSAPSSVAKSCLVTTTSVVLNAGDTLRMKFTVPPNSGADLLQYEVDHLPNPLVPGPSLSCQLFEGDRLLGSDGACAGSWQSSTASVRLPGAPLIDFSTIAAGTSAGRVDFIVSGGSWVFDGRGTVSVGRTIMTDTGTTVTYVAAGTTSPLELISVSCR